MKTAVIYSRVSDSKGRQSTERQRVDLEHYAIRNGYKVIQTYSEQVSGMAKNKNRPILEECISFCIDNHIDTLLLTEVSRLGRNTLEILKMIEILHDNKVNVYIQNLNIETLLPNKKINPIASIIMTILGELGNIEWQSINDRLNSGRRLYIEKGGKLGRKPGSIKTSEKKREEYKEVISLLNKNYSIRNVAKLTGTSVSTVQRIKKEFC